MLKLGYNFVGDQPKLKLHSYLVQKALPPAPVSVDNTLAISKNIGMMANGPSPDNPPGVSDGCGDCTAAGIAHGIILTTAMNKGIFVPTAEQTIAFYSGYTGYDPKQTDANGDNPTDTGASLTQAAEYGKKVGLAGHKIHGYLDVDQKNIEHIKQCIYLFGQCEFGVRLPKSAMDGFGKGIWRNTADTHILGGHDLIAVSYDEEGPTFYTWGAAQKATWGWALKYADECQARIYEDNIDNTAGWNMSAGGFDFKRFDSDLAMM